MPEIKNLTGLVFGKLTVLRLAEERMPDRQAGWVCKCECGRISTIRGRDLRYGKSRSCGCGNAGHPPRHGQSRIGYRTPEYQCWVNLRARCRNPNRPDYINYGARGISVCERWHTFENFLADMGYRPSSEHSIERKDNAKGYSPDNCFWATRQQQNRNRRNNLRIKVDGEYIVLRDLARKTGLSEQTIRRRLQLGASIEDVISKRRYRA